MIERPEHDMTNPRADRVKAVARLSGRSARLKTNSFRIEGPQGVREALNAQVHEGPGRIVELYYTPETLEKHPDIAAQLETLDEDKIFIRSASTEVISAMSDAQTPQGIVAVCELLSRKGKIEPTQNYAVLLCGVQDPGNVGTIIRVADASASGAVVLAVGSADVHNPKVVRSTVGSLFHLPIYQGEESLPVIEQFRAKGWQILAADGYSDVSLADLQTAHTAKELGAQFPEQPADLSRPTLWLMGNEARGLSPQELEAADAIVAVPLYGEAESLNVATAATLCLYASARAHQTTKEMP